MKVMIQVFAILFCLTFADATAQVAPTKPASSERGVFDSSGRVVGTVIGIQWGDFPFVAFEYNSIQFTLLVERLKFSQNAAPSLFFSTTNCTGSPLLRDSGALFGPALLLGSTVYLADTRFSPRTAVLNSSSQGGTCSSMVATTAQVFDTLVLSGFTDQWIPPFSVRPFPDNSALAAPQPQSTHPESSSPDPGKSR